MRIPIQSSKEPMILALSLQSTQGDYPIRIRVADADRPLTLYTDRVGTLTGNKTFYVRMPRTGNRVVADIFNPNSKDITSEDPAIKLVSKEILDIETFPWEYDSTNILVKNAIAFIEKFSQRAGTLSAGPAGSVYMSDCGHFRVDYLDAIVDTQRKINPDPNNPEYTVPNPMYGKELSTPARISQDRGIIEVSKRYFLQLPVPQRVAILLHEVSHFYFNNVQDDEEEADLNALKMFLGSGYGYIDAHDAFTDVFINTPSDENVIRHQKMKDFVEDFEIRNNKYR